MYFSNVDLAVEGKELNFLHHPLAFFFFFHVRADRLLNLAD